MEEERPHSRGSFSPTNHERRSPRQLFESSDEHMANVSLKAENDELKEQLFQLKTELQDEKTNEKYLRREQHVETQLLREEERKKTQALVTETRRKLYKEKQQEITEVRERLHSEKEKEIAHIIKQKDEELRKAQQNWSKEQEELIQKVRVQCSNEIRSEVEKSYAKQLRKLENCVEESREQKKAAEDTCKLAQDADKRKAQEIRRIHSEHEVELAKLKRSSWQEGRKQMAEIRQLTNIIYQLEKKLGVESGHYIKLQMEKDNLRNKLDRVKDSSGRRSPLPSNTDLSTDLSMFSFSAADDSNPLWLQLKQQKNTITQLKRNLQDKDRRIDLLKQKLFKNRGRFGNGEVLHRSMDDVFSSTTTDRDDCMSPPFGDSTGSSESSINSINDESLRSEENQDGEIIRQLRKELLTLEKAYSLLQAQSESILDAKRNQMEKEQLQTDLIEAHRTIDELNKELGELQDRNELLEFQQAENSQTIDDEENRENGAFNIPTLRVHYEFSEDELVCSAEEVKAKLEELENEKKSVFERDEQLTIMQAKKLIDKVSEEESKKSYNSKEQRLVNDSEDGLLEVSCRPVTCDVAAQCQLVDIKYEIYDYREELTIIHEGKNFKEVKSNVNATVQCNILGNEEGVVGIADKISTNGQKIVASCESEIQTDFEEFQEELSSVGEEFMESMESDVFERDISEKVEESNYEPALGSVQQDIVDNDQIAKVSGVMNLPKMSWVSGLSELDDSLEANTPEAQIQRSLMDLIDSDGEEIQFVDEHSTKWLLRRVVDTRDFGAQSCDLEPESEKEISGDVEAIPRIDSGVQCNLVEIKEVDEQEILEIYHEFGFSRFRKVRESRDSETQTDFAGSDVGGRVENSGDGVGEESVREKHVGELSEKSMIEETWKDFINERELGEGATRLDCVVYEKEEVLIVVLETCPTNYRGVLIHDWHEELSESVHFGDGAEAVLGHSEAIAYGNTLDHGNVMNQPTNQANDDISTQCDLMDDLRDVMFVDSSAQCPEDGLGPVMMGNSCLHCGHRDVMLVHTSAQCPDDVTYSDDVGHDVTCSADGERLSQKDSPCLSCDHHDVTSIDNSVQFLKDGRRHRDVTSVDCGVQCEFVDLLSSSVDLMEFSGVSELSSVFHESDGSTSLIKEVMELAKECSQNDALIDQHLTDVVKGQEYYDEYGNDGDHGEHHEAIYTEAGVQCLILTVPTLCDQQTECIIEDSRAKQHTDIGIQCTSEEEEIFPETVADANVQCSILNFVETCDHQTQYEADQMPEAKQLSDIGIQCIPEDEEIFPETAADANVQCSILKFVETCDHQTQYFMEISDMEAEDKNHVEAATQCIPEKKEGFPEILADADVQCSILNVVETCEQQTQCTSSEYEIDHSDIGTQCIPVEEEALPEIVADADVQCSILNFVETCDQQTQCTSIEYEIGHSDIGTQCYPDDTEMLPEIVSADADIQCSILNFVETCDEETQYFTEETELLGDAKQHDEVATADVQCSILNFVETCDQHTQYITEVNEQQHIEVGTQCDSENFGHFQNIEDFPEILSDVSVQCSILNFVETFARGTQSTQPFSVDVGVNCDILEKIETFDKAIQHGVSEDENEDTDEVKQDNKDIANFDMYSEISHSDLTNEVSESDDISMNCLEPRSKKLGTYDEIMVEGQWCQDVQTQCNYYEILGNSDKAVQCNLLDDGQRFLSEAKLSSDNSQAGAVGENQGPNSCLNQQDMNEKTMFELTSLKVKNEQLLQQVVELQIQAKREREEDSEGPSQQGATVSFGQSSSFTTTVKPSQRNRIGDPVLAPRQESVITSEEAVPPDVSVDLDSVFREMTAEPSAPVVQIYRNPERSNMDEPISNEQSLVPYDAFDEVTKTESSAVHDAPDEIPTTETRPPVEEPTITRTNERRSKYGFDEVLEGPYGATFESDNDGYDRASSQPGGRLSTIISEETGDELDGTLASEGSPEDMRERTSMKHRQSSFLNEDDFSNSEDFPGLPQSSAPTNTDYLLTAPDYPPPIPDSLPPIPDSSPPTIDYPPPIPDSPPPIPDSPPPTLPLMSPPGLLDNDLDEDIEALLAEEEYAGDLNPPGVRPTLEREVKQILGSESSPMSSEPDTVLSMDSLCANQTCHSDNMDRVSNNTSAVFDDHFDDVTEMTSSFEQDDVISPTVDDSSVEAITPDEAEPNEHESRTSVTMETTSRGHSKNLGRQVAFDDVDSGSSSSELGQRRKRVPPPVLPKPKYRSWSLNLPRPEQPRAPVANKGPHPPNSMAAQRDMVEGCFPPEGLVTKRASEFNLGEFDLLKERIVYLERQVKNKENLLQTMRAEATEIETNAYIQKKEEDLKMMDESIRFLKQENQKKEKELIIKIGELNKCNFELEQWKSERSSSEKQREEMEEKTHSLQNQLNQLQSVDVQFQELKCICSKLECENTDLHEQVNRLHRADEDFVTLEKTISNLQTKLKELEDVKHERDEFSDQLRAIKNQKDDLVQKGRKVETERNDFLMNSKLMEQQKGNLEARNKALQRTNDTFKTKISSLEKEFRECQKKYFEAQRERDESSSRFRKMETERDEMRKRVNELLECKSDLKQSQSKCRDFERELNYLSAQCKKLESQRSELSSELESCVKERNKLEGRATELEQLSRGNAKLEEKFHTLKLKIAELTSQRDDAEVQLPTLKAKVALLKKACKEKDEQLEKMKEENQELKHSIATSALDDLSKIRSFGFGSPENFVKFGTDGNNNISKVSRPKSEKGEKYVVLFDYDPQRLSTTGHPENELKLTEGDVITVYGEMDLNGYYTAELDGNRGLVSSLYIEEMDEYDIKKVVKKKTPSPRKPPTIPMSPAKFSAVPHELVKRPFVAVQDYNPHTASSGSSRPDLEIPLTAGELVTVVGDVDANGYYTVEKRGRLALIPSNLVKPGSPSLLQLKKIAPPSGMSEYPTTPVSLTVPPSLTVPGSSAVPRRSIDTLPSTLPGTSSAPLTNGVPASSSIPGYPTVAGTSNIPGTSSMNGFSGPHRPSTTQTVGEFTSLKSTTSYRVTENIDRHSQVDNVPNTRSSGVRMKNEFKSDLPSAPRNLRVLRCVNKDALLVGWIAPDIDEMGRNNGQTIKGFKIFANGEVKLEIESPYMAKALLENLDLSRPIELAIQTVAENGFCSEKTLTHFNEAVMLDTTSVTTEDVLSQDDNKPYKTAVALYTYDPFKNSPNPNPTFELPFQEGDIIRVIDTSRPDGFYLGQVGGKQGLVPSNFIEEIAVATSPRSMKLNKVDKGKDLHHSHTSPRGNSSSQSARKTKAMVALADYDPAIQSSNVLPDGELGFKRGQIIRVHGHITSDGFYEAEVDGRKGLVPSNYLKLCKRKSSKSPHSTNGYSSLPRRVQFVNHDEDEQRIPNDYV